MSIDAIISQCLKARLFFFKYISANDCGRTGGHQAGLYIPGHCWPLFLTAPGKKGENAAHWIEIQWADARHESRFFWYGKKTRSEYRLTRNLPFIDEHTGDLLIFGQEPGKNHYFAHRLESPDDMDLWLAALGLSPFQAGELIDPAVRPATAAQAMVARSLRQDSTDFPSTQEIARKGRELAGRFHKEGLNADEQLIAWMEAEYSIFCEIEKIRYAEHISRPAGSIDALLELSHTILNRRKSRAGQSLENHLSHLFTLYSIPFSAQPWTEQKKRPDFIFPGIGAYQDPDYPAESLVFLAAKTTCKDRWRQILSEADRIEVKHLCTLQQGLSESQLREMQERKVQLVVPAPYQKFFPRYQRDLLLSVTNFMKWVQQTIRPHHPLFIHTTDNPDHRDGRLMEATDPRPGP
ncbi:MAG: restriction endonuclease [Spirochaetales bacterium]|nr:restriction endonuclease [Spirochaetales bacterium]